MAVVNVQAEAAIVVIVFGLVIGVFLWIRAIGGEDTDFVKDKNIVEAKCPHYSPAYPSAGGGGQMILFTTCILLLLY